MNKEMARDRGWLIVSLSGNAPTVPDATWNEFRSSVARDENVNVVVDVREMTGASDRMVEILLGASADTRQRGGRLIVVGMGEELHARFGVMRADRYIVTAATVEEARLTPDVRS